MEIFNPELYEKAKQRMVHLHEVEEALKRIKNDSKLREILTEYVKNSNAKYEEDSAVSVGCRPLDLYTREYTPPRFKKWEEGQILRVMLSLCPTKDDPVRLMLEQKELYWWGSGRWSRKNGDWAVFYAGPDTGAGWTTHSYLYDIKEREVGFYLVTPEPLHKRGSYHNSRITAINELKEVTQRAIISNLERELTQLSI